MENRMSLRKLCFAFLLIAIACTPNRPWRTNADGSLGCVEPAVVPLPEIDRPQIYRSASVEKFQYPTSADGSVQFSVGVIEFAEDGSLWFPQQARDVIAHV